MRAACRSSCSAERSRRQTRSASSRRSGWPATSTSTARSSTSCRRWRRTSFRTTSTGAAARAWCSGIPVAYRFGNTIAAALTLNLSKGGVAIRTMSPLQGSAKLQRAVPAARIEARHRGRMPRCVERSPGGNGAAVREGRIDRSGGDRRVRRPALLQQPEGLAFRKSEVRSQKSKLLAQQAQRVRDHDQRRAHVGDDRHPQRRGAGERHHQERRLQPEREARCSP